MKKSILLAIFSIFTIAVFAQKEIIVQRSNKGLHILHTVAPKENFYSVGRVYNVPARDIAAYNGLDMSHGLTIGKTIQIPLNAANFSQEKLTAQPVYYVVGQKEGLFRVSAKNNNVTMASIRKWNNLTDDKIAPGQKLIVGYLIANGDASVAVKQEPAKKESEFPPITEAPKFEVVEPKKEEPSVPKEVVAPKPEPVRTVSQSVKLDGGGFFKSQFAAQIKSQPASFDQTVTAGIFKTSSGWQDAKYYALMDNVEPGTIIKIVNPNNNKSVYAKVLDKMAGIRQNQGFDLRLSNAAAIALEVDEVEKFFVQVVY